MKYMIGERVNIYDIIGYNHKDKKYICKCAKCGKTIEVYPQTMANSKNKGCRYCWTAAKIHYELIGNTFGNYTILGIGGRKGKRNEVTYICRCKCGNEVKLTKSKITQSEHICCRKCRGEYLVKNNGAYKHGSTNSQLYQVWSRLKDRCYNPKNARYKNYGERGIKVCEEWLGENGYENFMKWAYENGYEENKRNGKRNYLTIDRIDNDKGYCTDNCRWATPYEQANNKSDNVYLEYNGRRDTMANWARAIGIPYNKIQYLLKRGLSLEEIIKNKKEQRL